MTGSHKLSAVANADKLDIKNMVATRDPRFEATFWDAPLKESATLLYACKFIDRKGPTYYGKTYPPEYGSNTNTNDYPVMRLAEVVLNWIEAKAELATTWGEPPWPRPILMPPLMLSGAVPWMPQP